MALFRVCDASFVILHGTDGRMLLRTPTLDGAFACRAAILSIRMSSLLESCYERWKAPSGALWFSLRASDATLLALSPVFASETARTSAIEEVMKVAASAPVLIDDSRRWLDESTPMESSLRPTDVERALRRRPALA